MTLRTPLGRARGLGSAKEGVGHAWATIVTAVALVPLSLWFVVSLIGLQGAGHAAFVAWAGSTVNASLLILTVLMVLHHAQLGIQMVVEDYVHNAAGKYIALIGSKLVAAFLAVFMTVSILKVAVGG
ncbi:succinate dehydrogenase, hydrophobic membrane anchor protein [Magnetospirillum sp. UT-4]|uniref:succinate dehydrogenase, hydrophobic membrane anchor protein n=1 Tax=Magnetospirillum sp. UT-4 TaxID=2681467 RepID=UPI0013827B74|nr:succinate dehydrogenase, hydrophobic membrane anchor protein [Magnetospirillum sp. UT-4]CAA7623835.1 Succinate dehydrogenase, hydrophobic anchor subunit [Magnetospirillum sp. UT-4]